VLDLLERIAQDMNVGEKIREMMRGEKINTTEGRQVLHTALRMPRESELVVEGNDLMKDVWHTLDQIKDFSVKVRSGAFRGRSGKLIKNTVVIGIGGSYLGPMFAYEAIKFDPDCHAAAEGRKVRFLANVDPTDFYMATEDLDFEETLFVINSKTFTTAETMLNARTVKTMLLKHYREKYPEVVENEIIKCHFAACSTNIEETTKFGIDSENVFAFWNWVGGRFSVCSCIGMLPLSIAFGFEHAEKFLEGAHSMDMHYL
jgi:glucose-6-phosphate isomerase